MNVYIYKEVIRMDIIKHVLGYEERIKAKQISRDNYFKEMWNNDI